MNRSDLVEHLHARFPAWTHADVTAVVSVMLESMTESIATGEGVEVRGFGSFTRNYRPPRTGRNPRSGESVAVPGKYVPCFRPGKALRERVDLP